MKIRGRRLESGREKARRALYAPEVPHALAGLFSIMDHHDESHMRRALELARRARGRTSPNPMVGCVAVRDGAVIGEAYHEAAGQAHAEVEAVEAAGGDVRDATLYLTLEPCVHTGRTPPCADFLVERQPKRVVVAMEDPNPRVCGQGIRRLREAGIPVEVGLLEAEAGQLNEIFIKYITTGLPFVVAKCGMTLDGKIATWSGDSKWVTGEASRALVHRLRDELDAILVGSRTVMADDPSLTTRLPEGGGRDPIRVLVDAEEYLDERHHVFQLESNAPTWVVLPEGQSFNAAAETIHAPVGPEGVDMIHVMRELARREVTSVLVEGGGATLASVVEAGLVDKVMFFIAPKIAGGRDAVTAVEGKGAEFMRDAIPLERMSAHPMGHDILIEAYVKDAGAAS